ncbi:MAG TPA: phosphoadenylyl-sulfate reductase [Sphingomicrobium sp.]|nr:phosphoadenylyl-sulfate reductase [Sphingomicrobium sp.]
MADADFPALRVGARSLAAFPAIGGATLLDRLHSAVAAIDGRIVLTTSFGMEAQLIAHHIFTERLPIEVVTLDTGRLFPETYQVWQATEERYGKRIRAYYPEAEAVRAMVADSGINGFYYSREARMACCDVRKVEPLKRALAGASAWVAGLRADQSRQRSSVRLADWDVRRGLIKLAPLFDWTREEVAAECDRLGVPVNALYAQGYPSIGCEPCTRVVEPGEEERAGRWWWERDDTKECGLHLPGTKAA